MRKIFHFDSSSADYTADAAVLCCFDHRIHLVVRKFLQRKGIEHPDMIIVAGGAKTLASPRNDFERDFILEQVRLSIRLHKCGRIILMSHSDCATYGGLAYFQNDRQVEAAHHKQELQHAEDVIRANFPGVEVESYFVAFDGVWKLLGEAAEEVA